MSTQTSLRARQKRLMNRLVARLTARSVAVSGFVKPPEPRTIGSFAKGRQLVAGNYLLAGHLVTAPGKTIWQITAPDTAFDMERQGFAWLDDLASVGDRPARQAASAWVSEWIQHHGKGTGPGWTPDLAGRRLIRWINHAQFVLRGRDADASAEFFQSLTHQTHFLARRWHAAPAGLPRFEALAGLIYASLALEGLDALAEPAISALSGDCETQIDADGGIPTRNPEELLQVFTLLTWTAAAIAEAHRPLAAAHVAAIDRIAPTLRTLRHADGALARFHGGGRGPEGWLDHALAASGVRRRVPVGLAMGFARLSAGRSSIIVDASPPPGGVASLNAHASTLAFEMTCGRRPMIVNCGAGTSFGADWRRAGRATPSHTALSLDGFSSARLGDEDKQTLREALLDAPDYVPIEISEVSDGQRFQGGHNGYVRTHGLTHARTLELTFDGRGLAGEDMLLALDAPDKRRFDRSLEATGLRGVPYDIRFHLHPDADVDLDQGGSVVTITLKSGEIWMFRSEGVPLRIEPSVYLETGRLKPRATRQIVLSDRVTDYSNRIRWSLTKPHNTGFAVRDLVQDTFEYPETEF